MPELPLSKMQDIAGARVVAEMTREEQDRLVERITARFDDYPACCTNPEMAPIGCPIEPLTRTLGMRVAPESALCNRLLPGQGPPRRAEPRLPRRPRHREGAGPPVEIQVRTRLQDLWAQIVERLADAWGRGIRYGEPPAGPDLPTAEGRTRLELVQRVMEFAEAIDLTEQGPELLAELRADEQKLPRPLKARMTELSERFEKAERQLRELLSDLHNLAAPGTLEP